MRIRENFAQSRESEIFAYKPKIFIASEGSETEPKYFERLNHSFISENVTIINILRDYIQQGNCNPTSITNLLNAFLENSSDEVTVAELKRKIKNWEHENPGKINTEYVENKLNKLFPNDDYRIHHELLNDLFMDLFKGEVYEDMSQNFIRYFESQDVTYSPLTDTLNMVVDRDKNSFTVEQYDKVKEFCNKNNINLFVSNPNFEFWIFLHFNEVESEDRDLLLENPKKGKRRYIEKRLNEIFKYNKKSYSFTTLEPKISDAINREKNYEENIDKLKDNLGTNVGKLVENILNSK